MGASRVKITWLGDNVKKLTLAQARGVVEDVTALIFDAAKAGVPVGPTGDLKASGRVEMKHTPKVARAKITFGSSKINYAIPVEAKKPWLWPAVRKQKGKI